MLLAKLNILLVAFVLFSSVEARLTNDGTVGETTERTGGETTRTTTRTDGETDTTRTTDSTSSTTTGTTSTSSTSTSSTSTSTTSTTTTTTPTPPPTEPPGECECDPCDEDMVRINLNVENQTQANTVTGSIPGLEIVSFTPSKEPCTAQVLISVDFNPYPTCDSKRYCYTCLNGTKCSRRMLQMSFQLGTTPSGWIFNIGDSISNDGDGGDDGDQENNAEAQCLHPDLSIYQSAKCNLTNLATISDGCDANSHVVITISDKQIWYNKGAGPFYDYCNNCLYALNNQPDNGFLGQNQRLYISLNRVIDLSSPNVGRGLCNARFRWICPHCEH